MGVRTYFDLEDEPSLEEIERALPARPRVHAEVSLALRDRGRRDEARDAIARAADRWPDDRSVLVTAALDATGRADWVLLRKLVPADRELPSEGWAATLWVCRATARAAAGDLEGARSDARIARELARDTPWFQVQVGDAFAISGSLDEAVATWRAALLTAGPTTSRALRLAILERLARGLEPSRAGDALRYWREALVLDPGHAEARRRIADLTAGR
jgi:tetratricopeptide (TPR) repeat protein